MPVDIKPRILTTAINEDDGTASLDLAMNVADYFELEKDQAKAITADVGKAVSTWRDEAAQHGIAKGEINRMASAFEHDDLKKRGESESILPHRCLTKSCYFPPLSWCRRRSRAFYCARLRNSEIHAVSGPSDVDFCLA